MTRISNTARHAAKKPLKPVSSLSKGVGLEDKWQDRAGEEFEETGNYSLEECRIAQVFAHDHGDFDDGFE